MATMRIDWYNVRPVVNGWTVEFKDELTGHRHTAIFKTSLELANFFKGLDKARAAGSKIRKE